MNEFIKKHWITLVIICMFVSWHTYWSIPMSKADEKKFIAVYTEINNAAISSTNKEDATSKIKAISDSCGFKTRLDLKHFFRAIKNDTKRSTDVRNYAKFVYDTL